MVNGFPSLLLHDSTDIWDTQRCEVMTIDPHIEAKSIGIVRQRPVAVPVEHPRAVMGLIPNAHCIVTQDDELTINIHFMIVFDPFPSVKRASNLIVISENQVLLTIQSVEDRLTLVLATETEVPKMVDMIVMFDDGVPTLDHFGIHLFDGPKRSVTVFDNVFVPKVAR